MAATSAEEILPSFPFSRPRADECPLEYAQLRVSQPVSLVKLWDGTKAWFISSHETACAVLGPQDSRGQVSKDRRREGFPEMTPSGKTANKAGPTFVHMDEPERIQPRQLFDRLFSESNVESIYPNLIEKMVATLLQEIQLAKGKDDVDLYAHFATQVPTYVAFSILGAPYEHLAHLADLNATQLRITSTPDEVASANQALTSYLGKLLEERIAEPRKDILSQLVREEIHPGHLDKSEAFKILLPMLVTATISNLICYGVILLHRNPSQLADLKSDPSSTAGFVEELCRYHTSSAIASYRVAASDFILNYQHISTGEAIIISNQSANRDESVFEKPDVFDMHRPQGKAAIAFGYGPRRCPVEWLARKQLETVFKMFYKELPGLKMACGEEQLAWLPLTGQVGVSKLPVQF